MMLSISPQSWEKWLETELVSVVFSEMEVTAGSETDPKGFVLELELLSLLPSGPERSFLKPKDPDLVLISVTGTELLALLLMILGDCSDGLQVVLLSTVGVAGFL